MTLSNIIKIPEFPLKREILLDDKPLFDRIFAIKQYQISAYTFANIFAWRKPYNTLLSKIGDTLILHDNINSKKFCMEPIGTVDIKSVIEECFKRNRDTEIEFKCISSEVAKLFKSNQNFIVEQDRDNYDYVYLTDELINLRGRKFDGKRNLIKKFKTFYNYEYLNMTDEVVLDCKKFINSHLIEKRYNGLPNEKIAIYEFLNNFSKLELSGGVIKVDNEIAAVSIGSVLNKETFVVYVEKANPKFKGIYQVINNEFCIHAISNYKYVNREQDLGIPGIRKAKKSYQPFKLIETYRIKLKHA